MDKDASPGRLLSLWYELGTLYARAADERRRATMRALAVVCMAGALVLLSAPLFGTVWAASLPGGALGAAGVPLLLGGGAGLLPFAARRARFHRRRAALEGALEREGQDGSRPAANGLAAYYDAQLILLRTEYEYLLWKKAKKGARLFEESFGFTPEDGFEAGPLNVSPDTQAMARLRVVWARRIEARRGFGKEPPALGLREDLAYRVFPREMTVGTELAARGEYLQISGELLQRRYGRSPLKKAHLLPEELRARIESEIKEREALTRL